MKIVLRIFICAVLIAAVRCSLEQRDGGSLAVQERLVPDWPPPTDLPDAPEGEADLPQWPPTSEPPETDAPGAAGNDNPAWMVTAIVFIVLFVIAVGIAIYMYATLPPRYTTSKTFTLPRAHT
ncbi:hypothetical protein DMENIID0001_079140 [Sergentomyia squamirostris]